MLIRNKSDLLVLQNQFTDGFIQSHTGYHSCGEFLFAAGLHPDLNGSAELDDQFIRKTTEFAGWDDMMDKAMHEYYVQSMKYMR